MGIVVAEVPGLTDADRSSILEAARQRVIRRLMLENVRLQQLGEPRTRRLAA
jgi:hypothetical protein